MTTDEKQEWESILAVHRKSVLEQEKAAAIARLDGIVGECLELDAADVQEIRRDLDIDPFLRGIRPRYPGTVTRKQGFRTGLDSGERYR